MAEIQPNQPAAPTPGMAPAPTPASAAPDVTPATPQATPDMSAITGDTSQPAAPAGAVVIPPEYSGTEAPQAAADPRVAAARSAHSGFRAGLASAASNPSYTMDENGNMVNNNPSATGFKGLLGGILGGALRGAAEGMAAERGESGAAAAQRIGQAADEKARANAAATFERKRQIQKDLLEHNYMTAQTARLIQQSKNDAEQLAELHKVWARGDTTWAQTQDAYVKGQQTMMGQFLAQLEAHGVPPVSAYGQKSQGAKPGDVEVTNQGPPAPGEAVAPAAGPGAPGDGKNTILGQMTQHTQNYSNGKLTPVQNGGVAASNGVVNFQTDDLKKPITQPFYYQVFKGVLDGQGNPIMENRVIQPKDANGNPTTITPYMVLGEIMGAAEDADRQMKQLGAAHDRRMAALTETGEAAKIGLTKAQTSAEYAKAELDRFQAGGGAAGGNTPITMLPNLQANVKAMPPQAQALINRFDPLSQSALMSVLEGENDLDIFPPRVTKGAPGLLKQQAGGVLEELSQAIGRGHFDPTRAPMYKQTRKDFSAGGKNALGNQRLNIALGHLAIYSDNATQHGSIPGVSQLTQGTNLLGDETQRTANQQAEALSGLASELAGAYKNGEPVESEVAEWRNRLNGWTKSSTKSKAAAAAVLLHSKLHAAAHTWNQGAAPGTNPPIAIMSPEGRAAYEHLTGQSVDENGNLTAQPTVPKITQDDADAASQYLNSNPQD